MRFFVALFCALVLAGRTWADESAAACYERARGEPGLSDFDALRLCRGAESTAPFDCYVEARNKTFLTSNEARRLCTYANTTEPADCAVDATNNAFLNRNDIVRLCAPSLDLFGT